MEMNVQKTKVMRISRQQFSVQIKIDQDSCRMWNISTIWVHDNKCLPIPVAVRSKAWVCRRSFAAIAGSNPARGVDVCFLCVCVVR